MQMVPFTAHVHLPKCLSENSFTRQGYEYGLHPKTPNVFTDGDLTAVLIHSEEMATQVEHFSSADTNNFPILSDTNEHETACYDFANNTTFKKMPEYHLPATANEVSGDSDTGVIKYSEIGNSSGAINSLPSVSKQYKIVHIEGDGRCLFRSLIAGNE